MKKTLALVLALVMVIGMMAVPASAAYTDAADIQYTEAVDVMSAIGVIEGYNNEFNPKGELTRAAGAKLVAYLELGAKQAEALTAEKAPFADVPADHWAAGYIGWAASKGYINGVGDDKFAPDAPLTALAYAKLLLCALGYDAAIEGFTGNGWEYNVMALALDNDIFAGNDDADYSAVATREEAALYSFNALKADMVEYAEKGTKIEINGAVIATGASKAEVVTKADNDENSDNVDRGVVTINGTDYNKVQLAEARYTKLVNAQIGKDAFGRPAVKWTYDKETVGTYAETPVATFTKQVTEKDIYNALGEEGFQGTYYKYVVMDEIYSDGVKVAYSAYDESDEYYYAHGSSADANIAESVIIGKGVSSKVAGSGAGVVVEIYETDVDGLYTMVIINNYVGYINDWAKADADKGIKETVTVAAFDNGTVSDMTFETAAFDEADETDETVVIFTVDRQNGVVKSVVAAESVTGIVTATNGTKFTVEGTEYARAQHFVLKEGTSVAYVKDSDTEIVVYTDAYGNAIYVEGVEAEDAKYVLVVDAAQDSSEWSNGSAAYTAKVVFPGSDVEEVIKLKNVNSYNAYVNNKGSDLYKGVLCTYTEKDGKYELTYVAAVDADANASINPAKAAIVAGGDFVANAKTKFIVITAKETFTSGTLTKLEDYKYETVTGIKNMDKLTGDANTFVAAVDKDSDGVARLVVIVNGNTDKTGSVEDIMFVHKASKSSAIYNAEYPDGYITVKAYVDGVAETLKVAVGSDAATKINNGDFVAYGYDTDDGLVVDFDVSSDDFSASSASATVEYKDGNIKIGSAVKAYDDAAKAFYVDNTDKTVTEGKMTSVKETSAVTYVVVYNMKDSAEVNIAALYIYEA